MHVDWLLHFGLSPVGELDLSARLALGLGWDLFLPRGFQCFSAGLLKGL